MDTTAPNFNMQDALGGMPLLGLQLTKSKFEKRLSAKALIEKPKASNFPFTSISIGRWRRVSSREGDLMAKLYFAKRKLVWEFLDGELKSKIEVLWDDITAINAYMPSNQPGTLQIELGKTPSFFREIKPQPRKHTNWEEASDFTGGHALHHRIHYVKFPHGELDMHYPKLLQSDQNLFELSQRPFPSQGESPYFNKTAFSQQSLPLNNPKPSIAASPSLNPIMTVVHMGENSDAHQTLHLGDQTGMANHHTSFHEASFPNSLARGSGQQLDVLPHLMSYNEASFIDSYMPPCDGLFLSTRFNQIQIQNNPNQIQIQNNPNFYGGVTNVDQQIQIQNNPNFYGGVTNVDQQIIAAHDPSNNNNIAVAPINWLQPPTLQGSNIYGGVTVEQSELINYNNLGNDGVNIQHLPFNQY